MLGSARVVVRGGFVSLMFIGANDGSRRRRQRVSCCGAGWVVAYAARVQTMMRSYLAGGRSYVYRLTLPAPRPASFAREFPRVNDAIRRAAERVGGNARVIDLVRSSRRAASFARRSPSAAAR